MMETQPQPNTTSVFDVVLIRFFILGVRNFFLDSFHTCLASVPPIDSRSSGMVLCSDLESLRKTTVAYQPRTWLL